MKSVPVAVLVATIAGCSYMRSNLKTPTTSYESTALGFGTPYGLAPAMPAYGTAYGGAVFGIGAPVAVAPSLRWSAPFVAPPADSVPSAPPYGITVRVIPGVPVSSPPADDSRAKELEKELAEAKADVLKYRETLTAIKKKMEKGSGK